MLVPEGDDYEAICATFRWNIPDRYNIAADVCDRHATGPRADATALLFDRDNGVERRSYRELHDAANRFANVLKAVGIGRGDRIGIVAQPCFAVPVAHIATWKLAAVSVPMATLFAADALEFRFGASGVRAVVCDRANLDKVLAAARNTPVLEHVFLCDGAAEDCRNMFAECASASAECETADTAHDDPAFLNFTSGTTGQPKGVLAPHSAMLGHAASMEFLYDYPKAGDVIWSPADWAWLAGQMITLMAGLYFGMTVVARPRAGFDAEDAYRVLSEHGVTHALLIPTMMKMMRQVPVETRARYPLALRTVATGGEPCGAELYRWCEDVLGAPLNEAYGQTECSTMIINNQRLVGGPAGSPGKAAPGLEAAIVDAQGNVLPRGEFGEIAVRVPHPIVFLKYWNDPDATAEKFAQGWMLTGDIGHIDEDGFFWFRGRADDVITSSGYRIGPGEVEDALLGHPAVAMVAVIGVPDPMRTEVVSAFIVPTAGVHPDPALIDDIRQHVRQHLARHEVPRIIEFVDDLPTTTTGKIMRKALREQVLARPDLPKAG